MAEAEAAEAEAALADEGARRREAEPHSLIVTVSAHISPCISPHLPASPHISPHLPASPRISPRWSCATRRRLGRRRRRRRARDPRPRRAAGARPPRPRAVPRRRARFGEIWGDMGRYGETLLRRLPLARLGGAASLYLPLSPSICPLSPQARERQAAGAAAAAAAAEARAKELTPKPKPNPKPNPNPQAQIPNPNPNPEPDPNRYPTPGARQRAAPSRRPGDRRALAAGAARSRGDMGEIGEMEGDGGR